MSSSRVPQLTLFFRSPALRLEPFPVEPDGSTDQPPGCPSCGVVASRRKERRFQRIRDIPVPRAVKVLWSKYRWHCEWLSPTAVAVVLFHPGSLANQAMTEARQNLTWQVKGRCRRGIDKAWAHRVLLLPGGDTPTESAANQLEEAFTVNDHPGKVQAAWKVKEQLRALLHTDSLADAPAAREELKTLVDAARRPEINELAMQQFKLDSWTAC